MITRLLLYLWQLPQNLLGLLLVAIYRPDIRLIAKNGNVVYYSRRMAGGISLGKYSIIAKYNYKRDDEIALKSKVVLHEAIGHGTQSRILGPLYLPVIGLPSLLWACVYPSRLFPYKKNGYYEFYTEKWADSLAGIIR